MNDLFDEVRAALYSAWSRKWLALGVAWAVCLAGWLFVASIPNTYESHAKISSTTIRNAPDLTSK